ncbi:ubc-17, partial [Symbiodinium microadriaticum]
CGPGTYIFPDLLLRNSLGQFMDFGKVFCKLSELLLPYRDFVEPIAVTPDSLCYEIQNLAYWAEARTSSVFCLEGNGIITGVYRQQRDRKSSGVGYSVVNDSSELRKDTSYVDKLSRSMELILQNYSDKVVNSPLLELLCFLISELSVEEVLHSPRYASALFALFAHMQVEGHASSAKEEVLLRLLEFKSALDDECSLGQVLVPAEVEEALHRKQAGEDGKQLSTNACPLEPVTIVEQFHCHSYMRQRLTELPIAQLMSAAFMRRMRAELSTLCSSLPPSIRFMVLEQNYSYCKFLISGPVDTPYEGGFFVFDMALPPDYPVNSPAVVQSIAYLIFVEQPYFNEPGYSQWQGTPEGTAQNDEYNRRIRRYTMTHAVLDHLYSPDA